MNDKEWPQAMAELVIADQPPPTAIEVVDNHIYVYSEVDNNTCLALVKTLHETDARLRNSILRGTLRPPIPIWLHINSSGGDLFSALAAADHIANLGSAVYSVVEGHCASAATLIALACEKRYIMPHAFILIHGYTNDFWGGYEKFKDEAIFHKMLNDLFINFYAEHTEMSIKDIKKALQGDKWYNAEQALENGLAEERYTEY